MHPRVPDPSVTSVEPVHKDITRTKVVQLAHRGTLALKLRGDSCEDGGQGSSLNMLPHANAWKQGFNDVPHQPRGGVPVMIYGAIPLRPLHPGFPFRPRRPMPLDNWFRR